MSNLQAGIHQGVYDNDDEKQLLTLRENALRTNSLEVLDAIEMRLKKVYPKIYQRLVGPLILESEISALRAIATTLKASAPFVRIFLTKVFLMMHWSATIVGRRICLRLGATTDTVVKKFL